MGDRYVEVIDESTIQRRVAEMARDIAADHPEDDVVVICLLKGSLLFMKDLMDHLPLTYTAEFLALTRFGRDGRVSVTLDVAEPLEGKDVIVVLDIVDTGLTLNTIRTMLDAHGARSVKTAALLDKVPRRIVDVAVEYRGFEVGDEYLLGYGLDYEGWYRNLRSVWAVLDMAHFTEDPKAFASIAYGARSAPATR
nr:hypoxanthine phosphoribosyltransferase [Acidimicrobiia bacterium]